LGISILVEVLSISSSMDKIIKMTQGLMNFAERNDSRVATLMERTKADILATLETDIIHNAAAALLKKGEKVEKRTKKSNTVFTNR